MYNNQINIVKKQLEKRSECIVIIPTFKSAAITTNTIKTLVSSFHTVFPDILLVDGGGNDYNQIIDGVSYEKLNFIVLEENVGSSGAQYIGQKLAYDLGYKYFIHTDNDAELLTHDGISMLVDSLKKNDADIVLPFNIDQYSDTNKNLYVNSGELHFLSYNRNLIDRIGYIDQRYFLLNDDYDYISRAISRGGRVMRLENCLYYHEYIKITRSYNFSLYLFIRNALIFLFKNQGSVRLSSKWTIFYYYFLIILPIKLLLGLFQDPSILKTIIIAFRDFYEEKLSLVLPVNNFEYKKVSKENKSENFFPYGRTPLLHLLNLKNYYIFNMRGKNYEYFKRVRSK